MATALRTIAAALAGLLGSFVLVALVELFSGVVHPFPTDFKGTKEEICLHVERYPAWVLVVVVPLWAITAFTGPWIARRIGGIYASTIVGVLLLAALVGNVSMLPYPVWFKVVCLLAIPVSTIGGVTGRRERSRHN